MVKNRIKKSLGGIFIKIKYFMLLKTNMQYLEKDTKENYSELIEKDRENIRLNIKNIQSNLKRIERCL